MKKKKKEKFLSLYKEVTGEDEDIECEEKKRKKIMKKKED